MQCRCSDALLPARTEHIIASMSKVFESRRAEGRTLGWTWRRRRGISEHFLFAAVRGYRDNPSKDPRRMPRQDPGNARDEREDPAKNCFPGSAAAREGGGGRGHGWGSCVAWGCTVCLGSCTDFLRAAQPKRSRRGGGRNGGRRPAGTGRDGAVASLSLVASHPDLVRREGGAQSLTCGARWAGRAEWCGCPPARRVSGRTWRSDKVGPAAVRGTTRDQRWARFWAWIRWLGFITFQFYYIFNFKFDRPCVQKNAVITKIPNGLR
jgi:hypothetical protein